MPGIFLSYRRDDSQGEAHHLFDDLVEHFGQDRVFMDVTAIAPGLDFRKAIDAAVSGCDVLIVMIGKDWLDAVDAAGKRRLDDPNDFVRAETAAALKRDVPTIPVLVQGAAMPRPDELPKELEPLAWRNAFEVRHARWESDVAELVKALKKTVKSPVSTDEAGATDARRPRLSASARGLLLKGLVGAAMVAGVLAYLLLKREGPEIVPATMGALEFDTDRPGADYKIFDVVDPNSCQDACASEMQCAAFTFTKPGTQGPIAKCWLKRTVPPPSPNQACCISGIKQR